MTTSKTPRATVLVEWEHGGAQGVLVHADRYRNTWILPGGGIEQYSTGKWELPMAAAVRELTEETGLKVDSVKALFIHKGANREHHVFLARASGRLEAIKDSKEAPAFALCGPNMKLHEFLCESGYSTAKLQISASTKAIVTSYYEQKASRKQAPAASPAPPTPLATAGATGNSFQVKVGTSTIELADGDLVKQDVDAIVNAANTHLANGGGVCGAIFKAAGVPELTTACQKYDGCPVGEARITKGFKLKARHIIHAVGPRFSDYRPEKADKLLAGAYRSSLELASKHGLRSIAFPSISTGIFGFPVERAAPIVMETITEYLRDHPEVELVRLVLWRDNFEVYKRALQDIA